MISDRAGLTPDAGPTPVGFGEAVRTWARVGLLSFGGPAGQIAMMHRILVAEKRWVSESRFLHALNYCMLLPGPEAQQLATYVGWLLHGWRGGVAAGVLFVVPGFVSILGLSILYALYQQAEAVTALFFGLKAAVLAVVIEAVLRIGRRALANRALMAMAALAFIGIFVFQVPFPLIVLGAGVLGLAGGRFLPEVFARVQGPEAGGGDVALFESQAPRVDPTWGRALRVAAFWLLLWLGPIALLFAWLGSGHILSSLSVFFSKAALVTFGGAYSVLAYVAQQAVELHGWLRPGEMLDGLGMAETTPGPLIQVVQFVGFLGAYRHPDPFGPLAAGVAASVVVTWVTFVPCFLWIFLGAPYVERLRGNRVLSAGLSAITAAVVGVILNLALWFGAHVAFARVTEWRGAGIRLLLPDLASADPAAIAIALAAFVALVRFRWSLIGTLALAAAAGMAYALVLGPAAA